MPDGVKRPIVHIHYLRPPGPPHVFDQPLLHDGGNVKITLARHLPLAEPKRIDDTVCLEAGSDVVWFTFPGVWHDVGRFHRADGTFTGIYANILTPPVFEAGDVWRTTDLFLDVWLPFEGGPPRVLDLDELEVALERGWIDRPTQARALEEVERILDAERKGRWPPPIVQEWTLARARQAAVAV